MSAILDFVANLQTRALHSHSGDSPKVNGSLTVSPKLPLEGNWSTPELYHQFPLCTPS